MQVCSRWKGPCCSKVKRRKDPLGLSGAKESPVSKFLTGRTEPLLRPRMQWNEQQRLFLPLLIPHQDCSVHPPGEASFAPILSWGKKVVIHFRTCPYPVQMVLCKCKWWIIYTSPWGASGNDHLILLWSSYISDLKNSKGFLIETLESGGSVINLWDSEWEKVQ